MMDTCHYTFVQTYRMCNAKNKPNKPWTLGDDVVSGSSAVTNNATLVRDFDNRDDNTYGCGGIWTIFILSSSFD